MPLRGRQADLTALTTAQVVDLAHDGRGVARLDGKAVFVEGALPGERVTLRVFKRGRQFDEAAVVEILEPSGARVVPRCAHFGVCGGCALQHLEPGAQLVAKQVQLLENLRRIGNVAPAQVLPPLRGPAYGYRRRARLGVKYVHKKGRTLAGFRERDKPYIADVQRCEVLPEALAHLPEWLAALVDGLSIRERVPQVELAVGELDTALVFRVLQTPSESDRAALAAFGVQHGLQVLLQPGGLESIVPLRADNRPLQYRLDGGSLTLEFGPVDFIQVNAQINEQMVQRAMELLEVAATQRVLDLFCGLGNFTLPLARRAAAVVGVEGDAGLIAKARANAARNGLSNVEFVCENLFEPARFGAWAQARFDRVLIDPPRAGALELLPGMAQWQPQRIVYISCHPGSLARDAGVLVHEHGYALSAAGVMDMFPHTTHVESIAVFERRA